MPKSVTDYAAVEAVGRFKNARPGPEVERMQPPVGDRHLITILRAIGQFAGDPDVTVALGSAEPCRNGQRIGIEAGIVGHLDEIIDAVETQRVIRSPRQRRSKT